MATATGPVPIESINPGTFVWARDPDTGAIELKPVEQSLVREAEGLLALELERDDGARSTVKTTPEHPFWVQDRGWIQALRKDFRELLCEAEKSGKLMSASDLREVRRVHLEEAKVVLRLVEPHLAPEQYALIEGLITSYSMLLSQISEKTASLARIRRLFRLDTSERLAPEAKPAEAANEAGPTGAGPRADDDSAVLNGNGVGANPEPEKPKRKGHGRRRAADTKAKMHLVPLKDAVVGQCCEACERGRLYKL